MSPPHRRPPVPQRPPRRLLHDTCAACGAVLAFSDGCPEEPYPTAYRWGEEAYFAEMNLEPLEHCIDCWARRGMPHHHDCIRAECRLCDDERIYACEHGEDPPG